ncbi:hypothetical protein BCH_02474 [Brucella sp. 191011898]|nr:hypothetical protein BCH_02474 [Brucella sp. 191011898]
MVPFQLTGKMQKWLRIAAIFMFPGGLSEKSVPALCGLNYFCAYRCHKS